MKNDWKTSLAAIAKVLAALAYVTYKSAHSLPLTEVDTGLVSMAILGALGSWFSADAKKPPAAP